MRGLSRTFALVAVFLLGGVAMLTLAPPVHALSCAPMTPDARYRWADIVAVGAVESFDTSYSPSVPGPGPDGHEADVVIERYFKGTGPETITVVSNTAQWGRPWRESDVGERWLFFLRSEPDAGRYVQDACSINGPLNARMVFGLLGSAIYQPWLFGIIVIGLVAAGLYWMRRAGGGPGR